MKTVTLYFCLVLLLSLLSEVSIKARAARVDSLDVPSAVMGKKLRAAVVVPDSYAKNQSSYPVLYLLHGGGTFSDWLNKVPDRSLIKALSDQYNLLIVMPEGESLSGYLNSPLRKDNQFETYITQEVIAKIEATYRTIRDRKGRVISGLSMGGHGALYLATRHPELYCAAGSMSGAVNLNSDNWTIDASFAKQIAPQFERILGPKGANPDLYATNSVINLVDKMKANAQGIIIDCGVSDFLIEPNRELHRRLVANQTPHDYTERPGGHTWDYWQNSLPYHVLFFQKILKGNGALVP